MLLRLKPLLSAIYWWDVATTLCISNEVSNEACGSFATVAPQVFMHWNWTPLDGGHQRTNLQNSMEGPTHEVLPGPGQVDGMVPLTGLDVHLDSNETNRPT